MLKSEYAAHEALAARAATMGQVGRTFHRPAPVRVARVSMLRRILAALGL